jgi:anaerobic selenocysteine-containing dehydrogenase
MSGENMKLTDRILHNIPFILCFGTVLDETAEFADIVLPDMAIMERLLPFPNSRMQSHIPHTTGHFYWGIAQPVVKPVGEARHWCNVMLEIADRLGFLKDLNERINLSIADPAYRLDPEKKYTMEEIIDRAAKSDFGNEQGLEWFKEHGFKKQKRTLAERYPIIAFKPKVPIYYEHLLRGGEDIRALAKERNITGWDTSAYVALHQWKPSPAYTRKLTTEYDLFCINYKEPLYYNTISPENPWLSEIGERHPRLLKIEISTAAAQKRGIQDGDPIWVESIAGKVKGTAKVTECIHPEVIGIAGTLGSWAVGKPIARGKGAHHNSLIHVDHDRIDPISGAIDCCMEVKVYRAEGEN